MDSALIDADDFDAMPDPAAQSGEVCGLGVASRPCFDRDGAAALGEDDACAYCGWRPERVWVGNLCRSAAGMELQERRDLTVGRPRAPSAAAADLLHAEGMVGLYLLV